MKRNKILFQIDSFDENTSISPSLEYREDLLYTLVKGTPFETKIVAGHFDEVWLVNNLGFCLGYSIDRSINGYNVEYRKYNFVQERSGNVYEVFLVEELLTMGDPVALKWGLKAQTIKQ